MLNPPAFDLTGKRVFVAGHRGMVGSAVVRRLATEPVTVLKVGRGELDLSRQAEVEAWMERNRPQVVVIAAARVGGILANAARPVEFLEENLLIELNLIGSAARTGVEKLLFLGSSCIYPRDCPQPIHEDYLLTGPLEPTNSAYALAKIAGVELCRAYRRQHGADFISVMPTNLYGPGDNFDLAASHVVPALLRKAHEAKGARAPELVVWGSGLPRREFLHVDDLADACVWLLRHYSHDDPINVGSGEEVSIAELVRLIAGVVGFEGPYRFDQAKPDGTPRKLLDSTKLRELGWQSSISLDAGVNQTYAWYLAHVADTCGAAIRPFPRGACAPVGEPRPAA